MKKMVRYSFLYYYTDRETSARRRKALKRWSVLSIILLCLSLTLIIIAVWQTTDYYDRTGALFVVLPSGIIVSNLHNNYIVIASGLLQPLNKGVLTCAHTWIFFKLCISKTQLIVTAIMS